MKLASRTAAALVAVMAPIYAQGVITTTAGTGWIIPKLTLPGPETPLGLVRSMKLDRDRSLLVLDTLNHLVFRVSRDGVFTAVAGNGLGGPAGDGGPATRAALDFPSALATDSAGNIYIADSSGTRIRKVTPDGIINTIAGSGTVDINEGVPARDAHFPDIRSLAVLPGGDILVTDDTINRIIRIDTAGALRLFAGSGSFECGAGLGGPATEAALCDPRDLEADANGNVYFIDTTSLVSRGAAIRKIEPGGTITAYAGNGELGRPADGVASAETPVEAVSLGLDISGNVIAIAGFVGTGSGRHSDLIRIKDGITQVIPVESFDNYVPLTVAALDDGSFLFSTFQPSRISSVRGGVIEKFAGTERFGYGGDGGPAILAQFNSPSGLALGPDGSLYVSDSASGRVRSISPQGLINTVAGNGEFVFEVDLEKITAVPAVLAPLLLPTGIAYGPDDNLYYISAFGIHQLGADGIQYSASYATQAPGFITFDSQGRLIFVDTMRHIVIRVGSGGVALLAGDGTGRSTGDGGLARNAAVAGPTGVLGAPDGSVFISETSAHKVRRIAPNGIISTFAGTGEVAASMPAGPARAAETPLNSPTGLALDRSGNILVRTNGYLSRITPAGELTVIAGVGPKGVIFGDGGPATQAALSVGGGVAVDADGSIYFTEPDYNRIRKILAAAPSFSASPTTLEFTGASGGAPPRPQTVTVLGGVPSLGFSIRTQTSAGGSWLTASASDAVTPRLLQITANPATLAPGVYTGTVDLASANGSPRIVTINVRFTVGAALPANLQVDQTALSFTYPRTARRRGQLLILSNAGSGTISYEAAAGNGTYLLLTPARGTVAAGGPLALRVEADPGTRRPGTYRDTITIRWSGGTRTVNTVMTISDREQGILLSQSGLSFQAVADGGIVPPQSFRVLNTGNGAMAWRATASTLAGGDNWLRVTPASGVSDSAGQSAPAVEVRIVQTGLAPGVYYGLVQVESVGAANTPHVLTVSLEVLPPGSRPGSVVQPRELSFQVVEGQSASSGDLTVYNLTGAPVTFRSSSPPLGPNAQMRYAPIDSRVAPTDPQRIVVQPHTETLPAGTHRGSITFQFDDGTVRQVDINIVVTPRGPATTSKIDPRRGAEGCAPAKLVPSIRSIGQAGSAPTGWPTAIVAELHDDCGRAVDDGAVTMSFSNGDPPVSLQAVRDGVWHGTWSPRSAQAGTVTIRVQAEDRALNLKGEREIAADLRAGQDPPDVPAGGVVNTPSPAIVAPLAPGALITVNGSRLTVNQTLTAPPRQNLPTRLQDTEIIVSGRRLPLFAAAVDKAEAMLPFDLTPNTSHQVLVRRGLTYSKPVAIDVAPAQPAVLLNAQAGGTQALVEVRRPGQPAFLNTQANPARAGDTIAIFCGGLGAVSTAIEAGHLTPAGGAPIRAAGAIQARLGGTNVTVAQTSLVEGEIGRFQVVLTIPASVTPGNAVAIEIEAEGLTSAPATLAISAP